jgi:hypothetical protein
LAQGHENAPEKEVIPEEMPQHLVLSPFMSGMKKGWIAARRRWADNMNKADAKNTVLLSVLLNQLSIRRCCRPRTETERKPC